MMGATTKLQPTIAHSWEPPILEKFSSTSRVSYGTLGSHKMPHRFSMRIMMLAPLWPWHKSLHPTLAIWTSSTKSFVNVWTVTLLHYAASQSCRYVHKKPRPYVVLSTCGLHYGTCTTGICHTCGSSLWWFSTTKSLPHIIHHCYTVVACTPQPFHTNHSFWSQSLGSLFLFFSFPFPSLWCCFQSDSYHQSDCGRGSYCDTKTYVDYTIDLSLPSNLLGVVGTGPSHTLGIYLMSLNIPM